jgi:hypothetical protein
MVVHVGDFQTGDWESTFFGPAASLIAEVPLFGALGNHEKPTWKYYLYFDLPEGGGQDNEEWYAYSYGDCYFIVLDSNARVKPGSAQYAWASSALASAEAQNAEWLFVYYHHPVFCCRTSHADIEAHMVPLFEQYGVDVVFQGHEHIYERCCRNGIYYFVAGIAGGTISYCNHENPYQQYYDNSDYSWLTVDIDGASLTLRARRPNGAAFDELVVTHGPQPPMAEFSGNPTSGGPPLTVMFTDLSSNSPTSWDWSFGDSGTSTAQDPSHDYASDGSYTVSLTAYNAAGQDTETKPDYITVQTGGGGDFYCSSLVIEKGTLVSGDHTDLHASDDVYMQVASAKDGGKQDTHVEYIFETGLSWLSSLSVTVESHPSLAGQRQRLYVWSFVTSGWGSALGDDMLNTTSDQTAVTNIASPSEYLGPGGEVRVRVVTGDKTRDAWDHFIDMVKITAQP